VAPFIGSAACPFRSLKKAFFRAEKLLETQHLYWLERFFVVK
jgi:hypothetical protein